ncbi:MAG: leucine-rich repeat domain-containing protein, partial [Clostridia bacterium]|nr:leucine-rich repeat domain-containing protein [Clostridia bacterium]
QVTVLKDVLYKSAEKISAPYGPLFFYVPEYELYPQAIMAADALRGNAKALALVRDVCFIFGHIDRLSDVCADIDAAALYNAAKPQLTGVRAALCELFCLGKTDFEGGESIYPRCFNVKEARLFALAGHGASERMTEPFCDELGLYDDSVIPENDELVGLVTVQYKKYGVENLFKKYSTKKVTGIIFSPTDHDVFTYISIYRKKLKAIYYPENCLRHSSDYDLHFDLGYYVFWTDTRLLYVRKRPEVILPGELVKIPRLALAKFADMQALVLGEGITEVEGGGLSGPNHLASVEFPHSLCGDAIGFDLPRNVNTLTVPNASVADYERLVGVQNIVEKTELGEKTRIRLLEGDERDRSLRGRLDIVQYKVRKDKYVCESMFEGCENLRDIKLPSKITEIPNRMFFGCTSLENVMMPWNPTSIGESAFENCTSLWRIFLPEAITEIKSRAFANCVNLKKLFLPEKIQIIENEAFLNCIRISYVHLTPDVQYVSPTAFSGCTSLKIIEAPNELEFEAPDIKGLQVVRYEPQKKRPGEILTEGEMKNRLEKEDAVTLTDEELEKLLDNGHVEITDFMDAVNIGLRKKATSVSVSEGVTYVPSRYFAGCSNLERVSLPTTLPVIRMETFRECTGLTELALPEGVRNITTGAFRECTSLKNVILAHSTLWIGNYAFYGCTSLEQVRIPKGVRRIGKGAFFGCTALRYVRIGRNFEEDIEKIFGDIDRRIIEFI